MPDLLAPTDFQTDDSETETPFPEPPDFARNIPVATLEDAQRQADAQRFSDEQQQRIAGLWSSFAQDRLDQTVQNYMSLSQWQPPSGPTTYEPTVQDQPSAPAPEQPPQAQQPDAGNLISQIFGHLGGLADKLTGIRSDQPVGPGNEGIAANAPAVQAAVQGAPAEALNAATNPLAGGVDVVNKVNEANGGPAPAPTPEEAAQQGLISPQEAGAAQAMGGLAAAGPEALAAPVAGAVDLAKAGAGAVQDARLAQDLGQLRIPAIAGGSDDAMRIIAKHAVDGGADPVLVQKALTLVDGTKNWDQVLKNAPRWVGGDPARQYAVDMVKASRNPDMLSAVMDAQKASDSAAWDAIGSQREPTPLRPTPSSSDPSVEKLANAGQNAPLPPQPKVGNTFADMWRAANRGIVQAKMLNPIIHGENMATEAITQFSNPQAWGSIGPSFAKAEAAVRDPEAMAAVKAEAPQLNLSAGRSMADDLGIATKNALDKVPVVGGVKQGLTAVTDFNHKLLFDALGNRLQLASYYAARDAGMDATTAAKYANVKMGRVSPDEMNTATKWITNNLAFAGRWLQGTAVDLGSLIGKPGLLTGYAKDLTPAQQARLASALRGDFLRGVGELSALHVGTNYALSGHGPWQNEDGRWLDIDTGRKDASGKEIYLTDPFFRRVQDVLHAAAVPVPGNPLVKAEGTTTTATAANKLAPLVGTGLDLATGSKFLSPSDQPPGIEGGPPIVGPGSDLSDAIKQAAAFTVNQVSPVQVNAKAPTRNPEGIKLASPELNVSAGPDENGPVSAPQAVAGALTGVQAVAGPRDIGTKEEYFANQEDKAYGDLAKPFRAANVQISTMPNTLSAGSGSKKVDVPTTEADRPAFQAAYKTVLAAGAKAYPTATREQLKVLEQKAFEAGKAAVERGLTKDEITRRMGVAQGNAPTAGAFWKQGGVTQPATSSQAVPSSTAVPAGGNASAFWKKAA